ncbi:MAG: outer membrane beta-barrel protein [Bacteroidaceae bacterium]|nr:outer membrane beta-barrel protein [Bacteroidaceae bacterium]
MKKIFLSLMVMVAAVAANAQIWVGGSLGFRTYSEDKVANWKSTFSIKPEVGYDLSEDLSIAIGLGYEMCKPEQGDNVSTLSVNPYARYKFLKAGNFSVFVDGGFTFETGDYFVGKDGEAQQYEDENGVPQKDGSMFNIAIRPGVAYAINDNFSVVAHLGDGLIYRGGDNKAENGFALDIANGLSFGVYYAF